MFKPISQTQVAGLPTSRAVLSQAGGFNAVQKLLTTYNCCNRSFAWSR